MEPPRITIPCGTISCQPETGELEFDDPSYLPDSGLSTGPALNNVREGGLLKEAEEDNHHDHRPAVDDTDILKRDSILSGSFSDGLFPPGSSAPTIQIATSIPGAGIPHNSRRPLRIFGREHEVTSATSHHNFYTE